MNIDIPPILKNHENNLKQFFEGMVFKLSVNAFKDSITDRDVPGLVDNMLEELAELKEELAERAKPSPNALAETFDGANFWYLIFEFLRRSGVKDEREQFIEEYMTFDPIKGKVFAKRNRSGSRYRAGDEITGTYRNGRCFIRTQHALSGATVSLPRDHMIWWGVFGEWPNGEMVHRDENPSNDAIGNLEVRDYKDTGKEFPFVVQWKPAGKENHSHYGKWCYQRRNNMVLVKVGYWDTQEEAAQEGLKAWKARIKESA